MHMSSIAYLLLQAQTPAQPQSPTPASFNWTPIWSALLSSAVVAALVAALIKHWSDGRFEKQRQKYQAEMQRLQFGHERQLEQKKSVDKRLERYVERWQVLVSDPTVTSSVFFSDWSSQKLLDNISPLTQEFIDRHLMSSDSHLSEADKTARLKALLQIDIEIIQERLELL